jgi:hypothetical protein
MARKGNSSNDEQRSSHLSIGSRANYAAPDHERTLFVKLLHDGVAEAAWAFAALCDVVGEDECEVLVAALAQKVARQREQIFALLSFLEAGTAVRDAYDIFSADQPRAGPSCSSCSIMCSICRPAIWFPGFGRRYVFATQKVARNTFSTSRTRFQRTVARSSRRLAMVAGLRALHDRAVRKTRAARLSGRRHELVPGAHPGNRALGRAPTRSFAEQRGTGYVVDHRKSHRPARGRNLRIAAGRLSCRHRWAD